MSLIPVILCGGSGTRLWPMSRRAFPKQFQSFYGTHSLFQDTALRVADRALFTLPMVVTGAEYRFLVAQQLREVEVQPSSILLEPCPRNTAAAIAAAAFHALRSSGTEAVLLVLPSDHLIKDVPGFLRLVPQAQAEALEGKLVTFGAQPDYPHTGYGYIRRGAPHARAGVHDVAAFVEKPDAARAAAFLADGGFVWNCGMFAFRADRFLQELLANEPLIHESARQAVENARQDLDFLRLAQEDFAASPAKSIDYAVMERTRNAAVITADVGWSDVGSWKAISEVGEPDAQGNALHGEVIVNNVQGCLIRSEKRLVAASGVRDLVVIETADAILVAAKDDTEGARHVVAQLEGRGLLPAIEHTKVYRPWGSFERIDEGEGFQVKRLVVNPGAALSLQLHRHRAEHWVVVRGAAVVTRGEEEFVLEANQSTYIPVGVKHRLANHGQVPLEVVEIQSGAYLGEDDIVRFNDVYGRS